MDTLKESEWLTINKVLLEIYDIQDINLLTERILKIFRMLIPYSQGYFLVYDEMENIDEALSSCMEMEESIFQNYTSMYYEKDYLKYMFEISSHAVTYRDSDIIADSIRRKTEFYQEFLKPNNIPYGAGIVLRRNEKIIGVINLFRSGELGDFTDKDMFILDVLKDHLTHKASNLLYSNQQMPSRTDRIKKAAGKYGLSDREKEVMEYIVEGCSNADIGVKMSISISTVKKHVYNIFIKTGAGNRAQLRNLIE